MRTLVLCLGLSFLGSSGVAQVWVSSTVSNASSTTESSAETHADAVKLVQLMGLRATLEANRGKMLQQEKEAMQVQAAKYNPAFVDEWVRRMGQRVNFDDFVAVDVQAYESNFTHEELLQLIRAQQNHNAGKPVALSQAMKEKLLASLPTVQSEIMGGYVQVGSKLGGEIGEEIAKEHPDWVKQPAAGTGSH